MPAAHSFTYQTTKTVEIVAADGLPIFKGDVLRNTEDGTTGVVVEIALPGEACRRAFPLGAVVGELAIQTGPGCTRITNCYDKWVHVPREDQTYEQRFKAWLQIPYEHDEDREASRDEGLAIDGIMALLPIDPVDWESGPWPDRLDDALRFLVDHLTSKENAGGLATAPQDSAST